MPHFHNENHLRFWLVSKGCLNRCTGKAVEIRHASGRSYFVPKEVSQLSRQANLLTVSLAPRSSFFSFIRKQPVLLSSLGSDEALNAHLFGVR
jgi:hypothetical protein